MYDNHIFCVKCLDNDESNRTITRYSESYIVYSDQFDMNDDDDDDGLQAQ